MTHSEGIKKFKALIDVFLNLFSGMEHISFDAWQNETTVAITNQRLTPTASTGVGRPSSSSTNNKCPDSNGKMCFGCNAFYTNSEDPHDKKIVDYSCAASSPSQDSEWVPPKDIKYREITKWPHLNECIEHLEILNIGLLKVHLKAHFS